MAPKARVSIGWLRRSAIAHIFVTLVGVLCGLSQAEAAGLPTDRQLRSILTHAQVRFERAADGSLWPVCQCPVYLDPQSIPEAVVDALIAVEDRRYYLHPGIDPVAVGRAVGALTSGGRAASGASTLAMQLAKNVLLHRKQTVGRKLQEAILALRIEALLSKEKELYVYLQKADFGASDGWSAFGLQQAAHKYFRKDARDLNLFEAAVLVGSLQNPGRYNYHVHPVAARERATTVLRLMVEAGAITEDEMEQALRVGAQTGNRDPIRIEPRYFAALLLEELRRILPDAAERLEDLKLVVAVNPNFQYWAQRALARGLMAGEPAGVGAGALVTLAEDGAVRAMVGAQQAGPLAFDHIIGARRQPGSAFKLFTYLAALENGYEPESRVLDAPLRDGWPKNPEGYKGEVSLKTAFAASLNGATVRLAEAVGRRKITSMARRLGITSDLRDVASLPLGTSEVTLTELTAAYAVVANQGHRVQPYGIIGVLGRDGQVLYWREPWEPKQVLKGEQVEAIDAMLRAAVSRGGTGEAAKNWRGDGGKTGTTQKNRDAWFVGYTDTAAGSLVTGIWMGNADGSPTRTQGGELPAATARNFHANIAQRWISEAWLQGLFLR